MIDPTKSSGIIQNLLANNKPQAQNRAVAKGTEASSNTAPRDQVNISEQALSLSQAELAVKALRQQLTNNPDVTLGLDPAFDEKI
jgi:hypothetical protein